MLWRDIIKIEGISAVLVYTDNTEHGYTIKKHGKPTYEVKDMDGLPLIMKPSNFQTKSIAEKLWAKKPMEKSKIKTKKSLIDHMLETGAVAECLLYGIYAPLLQRVSELTGIGQQSLSKKIVFICALHDIGKAHPIFQGKDNETESMLRSAGLNQLSFDGVIRHEKYAEQIVDILCKHDCDNKNGTCISQIIGLHHQKERKNNENNSNLQIDKEENKARRWREIQRYIYNYIKEAFPFDNLNILNEDNSHLFVIQNTILGILITADWIASNEDVFPEEKSFRDFADVQDFIEDRKKWIYLFLSTENLIHTKIPIIQDFKTTFGFDGRPVQKDVESIVKNNDIKVMLIESGCGSGKTEAALYAASVLGNRYGLSGMYMGLPTGVSAAALQDRMEDFLFNKIKINGLDKTKLLTSQAFLLKEHEEDGNGDNIKPEWTDTSRQRLLYPYSIGTVDQVMTVARLARFESVRMAGLSSKVLIIDEIHAYDIYMMTIIEKLIQICEELGVPVILLSATLPISTKKNLFATATGMKNIDAHDGYPMISYVTKDNIFHEQISKSHEEDRKIDCELLPILNQHDEIAKHAVYSVSDGGCQCVIMNTVKDAIRVYDEIKKIKDDDCKVILYHAKMTMNSRDKKSKEILKLFGKDRSNRPKKAIVVGTQVLEQSLDVDFDYMMTAICPIDLLLQRIGRYHRHSDIGTIRERKELQNKIQVLIPEIDSDYGGTGYVYEPCYLNATINVLRELRCLAIPSCTPKVINEVYSKISQDVQVKEILEEAKSDVGNIDIKKGFEIYTKKEQLTDDNLSVRLTKKDEESIQIAVLNKNEIDSLGKDTNKDIEIFKNHVVSVGYREIKDFEDFVQISGIFKRVRIYASENCEDKEKEKRISIDNEYGFRIMNS